MHAHTFEMLKITVKRLLCTLTQYDYFNVLQVFGKLKSIHFLKY